MKLEQIKYSKCPNCKNKGLPFFKIGSPGDPVLTCKCCGKKYKFNSAVSITITITVAVLVVGVFRYINENISPVSTVIPYIVGIGILILVQYFIPPEEYDNSNSNR